LSKNNFAEICTGTYGKNAGEADEVLIFTTKIASRVVLALIKGKHKKNRTTARSFLQANKQKRAVATVATVTTVTEHNINK